MNLISTLLEEFLLHCDICWNLKTIETIQITKLGNFCSRWASILFVMDDSDFLTYKFSWSNQHFDKIIQVINF